MADKKETGGLLNAQDVQSSAINTIPNQVNYLDDFELLTGGRRAALNTSANSLLASDAATFFDTERALADPSAVRPGGIVSPEAAPGMYKTIYQTDLVNSYNLLGSTIKQFKTARKKDKLARLNYQLAVIEEGKYKIDELLESGRINAAKHKELRDQLVSGDYSQVGQQEDLFKDVFQMEGVTLTDEDVARGEYMAKEYGLLNQFMDKIYGQGGKMTYDDMLQEKQDLLTEVEEKERDPSFRFLGFGPKSEGKVAEDYLLQSEISEDSETTLLNNPGEYFRLQAARDLAGTLSTAEGWLYSLGGPAVVRTIQKRLPKVVSKFGTPGKIAAALLQYGSMAYGIGLSRHMETSMEAGDLYWQKVDEMQKDLLQKKADQGLPQQLTEQEERQIAIQAYKGIETLKNKNYKLGSGDLAQFLLTFGTRGKTSSMFGMKQLGRAVKSKNLGKIGTNLASFTGRIGLSREIEGAEEGLQFMWTQDYLAGDNARQTGFVQDYTEYFGDRTGVKPGNPDLYKNLGFKHAVQSGKDMATMMTGSGRAMHGILDLYKYRQAIGSLQNGDKIDKDNMNKIQDDVILDAYKRGNLENLRLAILKAGSSDKYEGINAEEAKEVVARIDKAEVLLDEIYSPKSPIGFSLAGFDIDPLRDTRLEGQEGIFGFGRDQKGIDAYNINKEQAFYNAMEIVSKEERLAELEQLQSDYRANQDNTTNSMFGLDDLSTNEKKIVEKKLKDRGITTTPYDLEIEELKNNLNSLKTDNRQVATGDYVYSGSGYMTMDEFRRANALVERGQALEAQESRTPAEEAELNDIGKS